MMVYLIFLVAHCFLLCCCQYLRFVMALTHQEDEYGNAPEVDLQQHTYIYPVIDQTPPCVLSPADYHHARLFKTQSTPVPARETLTKWWILALAGLSIAIVAGLIGGFIGRAIQDSRISSDSPATVTRTLPAATMTPSPPNGTSSTKAPPQTQPSSTTNALVPPDTGCNFPTSKERQRLSNQTDYSRTAYTTICNSGWVNAALSGFWTLTPSDCVEACALYNKFLKERSSNALSCVGGGFIPSFVDRKKAIGMSKGVFNCYLQYNSKGITPNDLESSGVEVVALCLDGQCDGAGIV
jgi:hypothetical protein